MLRFLAAAAFLSLVPSARAITLYRNLDTPLGTSREIVPAGAMSSPEIGNTIIVATDAININALSVQVHIGGSGEAQFDVRARLYDNGGPNGQPGLLLWDSQPVHVGIDSNSDSIYYFGVSDVVVSSATWTLEITNRTGPNQAAISLPQFGPPTTGSVVPGSWAHGPGGWTLTQGEPAFGAELDGGPGQCCAVDYNGDDIVGDDHDIEDFFRCLGGDCCPTCVGPDFNCDGDVATDADIESFFRVLAGGPC
jgi:hypothetical protein